MPPTARKRTTRAAKATADKNGGNLEAVRAEVAAEPEGGDQPYVVALAGTSVKVKHFLDWPASGDDDLAAGRFTVWARKVLVGDDYTKVWQPMDPTNRQVIAFFSDLEAITGIPFVTRYASPTS
jgi:hypothetical protein